MSLHEISEFFNGEAGLTYDRTKRSLRYFLAPRDSKSPMGWVFVSQDDMTARLMINAIPGFGEGSAKLVSRNQG